MAIKGGYRNNSSENFSVAMLKDSLILVFLRNNMSWIIPPTFFIEHNSNMHWNSIQCTALGFELHFICESIIMETVILLRQSGR